MYLQKNKKKNKDKKDELKEALNKLSKEKEQNEDINDKSLKEFETFCSRTDYSDFLSLCARYICGGNKKKLSKKENNETINIKNGKGLSNVLLKLFENVGVDDIKKVFNTSLEMFNHMKLNDEDDDLMQ